MAASGSYLHDHRRLGRPMRNLRSASAVARCLMVLVALAAFEASAGDGSCTLVSEVCLDGPSTKVIGGQSITRACWQYQDQFNCASPVTSSDCQPLIDRGCFQVDSTCVSALANGQCSVYQQTYSCKVASGQTSTITNCGNQSFCLSGNCFSAGSPPDGDFAKAVAVLEAEREAGKYLDPNSLQVFKGFDNRCRKSSSGSSTVARAAPAGTHRFSATSTWCSARVVRRWVRWAQATPTTRFLPPTPQASCSPGSKPSSALAADRPPWPACSQATFPSPPSSSRWFQARGASRSSRSNSRASSTAIRRNRSSR